MNNQERRIGFNGVDPLVGEGSSTNARMIDRHMRLSRRVDGMMTMEKPEVVVKILSDEPIRVLHGSDFHYGHNASDIDAIDAFFKELDRPDTVAILYGDLIEGITAKYISTNVAQTALTMEQQIVAFREKYLRPRVEAGKIVAMVGMYDGHEGWASESSTIDAVRLLVDGLRTPDGSPVPLVYNGGDVVFEYPDGKTVRVKAYHNPGGGGSMMNPLGSQRARIRETPLNHPSSPDMSVGGHYHDRSAASVELSRRGDTGREVKQVLIATGTVKGVDADHPDHFNIKRAKGLSRRTGAATIMSRNERGGVDIRAVHGLERSRQLQESVELWDMCESLNMTDELRARILERYPVATAEFLASQSRDRNGNRTDYDPLYEKMEWKIRSGLPVVVYTFGNARYGSSSLDRAKLQNTVNEVANNPHAFALALRHMVDSGVSKRPDRMEVLDRMVADLRPVADDGKLLGLMLSGSLREDPWLRDIKREGEVVSSGLITGNYLGRKLKAPIYGNEAEMNLIMPRGPDYSFYLLDHLAHSGSQVDPFRGLRSMETQSRLKRDFVVGGHMPNVGVMESDGTTYIAAGWFAECDSLSKSNVRLPPLGGQAVILFPNRKVAFSSPTFFDAREMHEAMMLYEGLRLMKELDKVRGNTGR